MVSSLKVILVILLAHVSNAKPKFNQTHEKDLYNSIRVYVPFYLCDASGVEVPDFTAPGRRISEAKCLEYIWRLRLGQEMVYKEDSCTIRSIGDNTRTVEPTVIGGREAEYGEYPHMVAIGWKGTNDDWIFKCGGSLISDKFVLTAAHCSKVPQSDSSVVDPYPKIARLGSKNIMNFDKEEDNKPANDIAIKNFTKHPKYKPPRQYYDIALIELIQEVPFTWRVHPACLWTKFDDFYRGMVTGWGVVDLSTRKSSPTLQKAEITIIDQKTECDEKLKKNRNRRWQGFKRHQLCAGEMSGGVDTCQGDSGGPLQSLIPLKHPNPQFRWNIHHIIGVTSFGFGCARANTPSVYTRVASFIAWIEDIVWKKNVTVPSESTAVQPANEDRFYFST